MSSNRWREVQLKEVIQFNPKESIKKGEISKKIGMEKLNTFQRKIEGFELIEFNGGMKFRNGDTLLARITPCLENGKTAQVSILNKDEVGFGSTEFVVLREVLGLTINDFIYYLSISPEIRNISIKSMTGTTGRQRAQIDIIQNTMVSLPPIREQKSISSILSALDDKIELNNLMNKVLEQIAQAIFKQWFVDFEFPDDNGDPYKSSGGAMEWCEELERNIPRGWKITQLSEIIAVKDGTHDSPKKSEIGFPLITSKHLKLNRIDFSDANLINEQDYIKINERSKVDRFDILISMIGTIGTLYLVQDRIIDFAIKNIGLFKTSEKESIYEYVYLHLKSEFVTNHINERLAGSTQQYISLGELRKIPVIIPHDELLINFKCTVNCLISRINSNSLLNHTLTNLRDTILPKLMSGEIDVSQVEL
ncbi:MAG: restriction endonuclease subunit S [Paenibacillaceae bacterium]